jgi:hypothetical protein
MNLFFDIETLPSSSTLVIAHLARKAGRKAPHGPVAEAQRLLRATSLDGTLGDLALIGAAIDDDDPVVVSLSWLIDRFADRSVTAIGYNSRDFDLPFLRKICLRSTSQPWCEPARHVDVMRQWDPYTLTSLDALCAGLGIDRGGDDTDGSDVARLWREGRSDIVAAKCLGDVAATRNCWRALQ